MLDKAENGGQFSRVDKQTVLKNKDVMGGEYLKDRKGKLITEEAKIKMVWKEYFEDLLNEKYDWKKENLEVLDTVPGLSETITFVKVEIAIPKAKAGKAPRPTGIVAEMLKAAGDVGIQWMNNRSM